MATVVSCLVVLGLPQAASAAELTDGAVVRAKATTRYDVTTSRNVWAAVGVYQSQQWNASLFTGSGAWLASSTAAHGMTDFVAVDSHRLALAAYRAEATRVTGYGAYVQWRQATDKVVLPVPANDGVTGPSDPDLAFAWIMNTDVVSVAETWLYGGEAFWVNSLPNVRFFLLESDPYDPGSSIQTRAQAASVPGMRVVGNCTLYRANHTGWHGLLMVSDQAPQTTVPAGGHAVALHRFDPARPNTCPQRNFPDYTPPG